MITRITRPVEKRCPYRDEIDAGSLTIEFDGPAPELHELAAKVDQLCAKPISHEKFTDAVVDIVAQVATVAARVATEWNTGPWLVEVREP